MLEYGLSVAEIREEQRMEYARLGNTGLMVSELCLGCMTFGQEADEETSKEIVGRFLDAGATSWIRPTSTRTPSPRRSPAVLSEASVTTLSWPRRSASRWEKARTMSASHANT